MMKFILTFLTVFGIALTNMIFGEVPEKRVKKIHERVLTVDTHCDTPMNMLEDSFDIGIRNNPPQSRVDFPRMKEGGLDAMFFAAFDIAGELIRGETNYNYFLIGACVFTGLMYLVLKYLKRRTELLNEPGR